MKKTIVRFVDTIILLAIVSYWVGLLYVKATNPLYLVSITHTSYSGEPILLTCNASDSNMIITPNKITELTIDDETCFVVLPNVPYVKTFSPPIYFIYRYQNIISALIILYLVISRKEKIKSAVEKAKSAS